MVEILKIWLKQIIDLDDDFDFGLFVMSIGFFALLELKITTDKTTYKEFMTEYIEYMKKELTTSKITS